MLKIENFNKLMAQKGITLVTPHRRWLIDSIHESIDSYLIRIVEQSNASNNILFILERDIYNGKYALRNNRDLQYRFVSKNQITYMAEFLSELKDEAWRFN